MIDVFRKELEKGLTEIGIPFEEEQINLCCRLRELLILWNEKINLTGITEPREMAIKHFIDALMCVKFVNLNSNINLIDIGTGAGFPGIPLRIFIKDLRVTLLDALGKRCNFLQTVVDELKLLNVSVVHGRAEEKGKDLDFREIFDVAAARAVTSLPALAEYCLPFVKKEGLFISLKGPDINTEVNVARQAIALLGGEVVDIKTFSLPFSGDKRTLVIIRKVKNTPDRYPRKAGVPEKRPIL